ncbi:glycosyltransferase [Vibrio sinaloensis]|uniref:glycosyltransferase n=1 Tax=Photobacterium sp. (strain ATCC 43367) TaxID=379097 RepID=UPI00057FD0B5|nr:glycosyltransferase [Vibrio sinaloensis]KHT46974.1 hypothetical protein RJ46_12610 [Vibrio sinaloensis]
MKILFRISKLGFGGAEQVFLSVAKELYSTKRNEIIFVVDNDIGENVNTAKMHGFKVISLEATRTMKSIWPLKRIIEKERPDVIISAYTDTNAACLISSFLSKFKCKVIVSEHASLHEHWAKKSKLKRLILTFYVAYVYRLSDKVICVSNGLKNQVSSLLKARVPIETIYNPVRFKPRNKLTSCKQEHETLQLLAVGRISEPKDYDTLIKSVQLVSQKIPVHLTIVGGVFCNNELEKLKKLVSDLKIENSITFAGFSNDVQHYYSSAHIFVLSSAWEGFGNVIVEAMAFGLPIISTDCNYGPAEILEHGRYGRLVPVSNSTEMAKAIIRESQSPLVDKSQLIMRSTDFSESKIASQYLNTIERTLNEEI